MKKITLALVAILGIGLLFTSCTKKEYTQSADAETEIFDIHQSDWQKDSNGNYYFGTNLSSFTESVHFDGAYWAYISFDNESSYELLTTNDGSYEYHAAFDTDPDNNKLYGVTISALPFSGVVGAPSGTVRIKIVSIPSTLLQSSNVNPKDYNAVKATFHLK